MKNDAHPIVVYLLLLNTAVLLLPLFAPPLLFFSFQLASRIILLILIDCSGWLFAALESGANAAMLASFKDRVRDAATTSFKAARRASISASQLVGIPVNAEYYEGPVSPTSPSPRSPAFNPLEELRTSEDVVEAPASRRSSLDSNAPPPEEESFELVFTGESLGLRLASLAETAALRLTAGCRTRRRRYSVVMKKRSFSKSATECYRLMAKRFSEISLRQ